nr:unnamed protein product [Spirometra erinaceieuropaei]
MTKRKQDVKQQFKKEIDLQIQCHLRLSDCIKLVRRNKVIKENVRGYFLRTYLKNCWKRNIQKKAYNLTLISNYVVPPVRTITRTKRSARQRSLADALRTETLHLAPLFIKPVSSLVLSAQNILPMNGSTFSPFDILQYHFRVLNIDVGVIERFSSEFFPNASRLDTWVETNEFSGREVDSGHVRYTGNIVQSPEPSATVTERVILHAVDTDQRRQANLILRINFIRINLKVVASGPLFVFRQPKNTLRNMFKVSCSTGVFENKLSGELLSILPLADINNENIHFKLSSFREFCIHCLLVEGSNLQTTILTFNQTKPTMSVKYPQFITVTENGMADIFFEIHTNVQMRPEDIYIRLRRQVQGGCLMVDNTLHPSALHFTYASILRRSVVYHQCRRNISRQFSISEAASISGLTFSASGFLARNFDHLNLEVNTKMDWFHWKDEFTISVHAILRDLSLVQFLVPSSFADASSLERLETNTTEFSASWEDPVIAVLQMTQPIVPLTDIHQHPKLQNVFSDNFIYKVRRNPTRGSLRIIFGQFLVDNISKYTQEDVRLKRVMNLTVPFGEEISLRKAAFHIGTMPLYGYSVNRHEVSRLPCSLYYENSDSSDCPKTKYSSSDTPFLDQVFEIDHQPECGKIISKRLAHSVMTFSLKTLQQDDIFFVDNGNETCNFANFEVSAVLRGARTIRIPSASFGIFITPSRTTPHLVNFRPLDVWENSFVFIRSSNLASQQPSLLAPTLDRGNQINYLVFETLNGFLSNECDNKIPISSFTETDIQRNRVCFHHASSTGSLSAGFRFQLQQAGIRSRTWNMPIRVRRIVNVSVVARPVAVALHVPTEITVENLQVVVKESTHEAEQFIHSQLHPRSEFCHQPDYEIRFTVIKIPHYCAVWKALHNGVLGHALENSRSVLLTNFTQCDVFERQLRIICSASMAMSGTDKFPRPSEELQLRLTVFVPAPPEKKEAILTEREVKLPILIYQQSKTDQTEILPVARVHFAQRTRIDTFAVALFDNAMRPYKVSQNATIHIRVLPVYGTMTCGNKSVRLGEAGCKVFDYTHRGLPSTGDFVEFDITASTSPNRYDSGIILPIVIQFPVKSRKSPTDSVGQRTIVNEQIHHRLNEESFTLNLSHFSLPRDLQNHELFFEVDEAPLRDLRGGIEELEKSVFIQHQPTFWNRYTDDRFVIVKKGMLQHFHSLLNAVFPDIKFTKEEE